MPSERAWATDLSVTSWPSRMIRPVVGGWKPQMILIRVDLPAPLSPIRPSTSPRRRCMFTSTSAVTAPYFLEMCSTLSTSSSAPGGTAASCCCGSVISGPPSLTQPGELHVRDHGDQDGAAEDDRQRVRADPDHLEADGQHGEHDPAEERADDGAR